MSGWRSEEHTSELQSRRDLVCRLLLETYGDPRDLHSFPTRRSPDLRSTPRRDRASPATAARACPRCGFECPAGDRKSTRLNSSHVETSYAVFCLKHTATPGIYTLSLHDALPISDPLPAATELRPQPLHVHVHGAGLNVRL